MNRVIKAAIHSFNVFISGCVALFRLRQPMNLFPVLAASNEVYCHPSAVFKTRPRVRLTVRPARAPGLQDAKKPWALSVGRVPPRGGLQHIPQALLTISIALCAGLFSVARAELVELRQPMVVCPSQLTAPERKAIQMLEEEIRKRTWVSLSENSQWPANADIIAVGPVSSLDRFSGPFASELRGLLKNVGAAEGYRICVRKQPDHSVVFVIGNDSRGVLFGIGRLLRELRMTRGRLQLDTNLDLTESPKYPLRGHQLGYRPKCNSYDAWDLPTWEQYYRDLAVFGCNAVELIPPRSDDAADSPHFPRPPLEMMIGMSKLADDYGLDVWIWYPAMDADYSNPATVEAALAEWQQVFSKLPRIDAVFVPGGDPGHTEPKFLLALLEKQTQNLHRFHPKARMWVSPQSFNREWMQEFVDILQRDQPSWLSGVVFGPQVRISLSQLRQLVPKQYPIRHYPDITHSRQCQYPVPDWDVAYALTEARECINPRPEDEAAIFRKLQPGTVGFISYSEGCNDDVNKIVWSGLGWNPDTPVTQILQQYSRYFISQSSSEQFAQGLLALERDWRGSLLTNQNAEATFALFQKLERAASPAELRNWRFQQALFRAYYDYYTQRRLVAETEREQKAMQALRDAPVLGAAAAISYAQASLFPRNPQPTAPECRARILELGEALFQSIGMQLSVQKYKAIGVDRGASLDTLDFPLNNRVWLFERFAAIAKLASETERLKAVEEILHWTDPGPGGFYDDLGNPSLQPHLVREFSFKDDPGAMQSPRTDYEEDLVADEPDEKTEGARRLSWMDHAETLYDVPLRLRYTNLDPHAQYKVRVVYAGDNPKRKVRLMAGPDLEIHPLLAKPVPFKPLEFPVPQGATMKGTLTLEWFGEPGLGGNGRGCQVSEVWLLKEPSSASP